MERPRTSIAARLALAAGASIGALALIGALRASPVARHVAVAFASAISGSSSMTERAHRTNRLAREKSPYLLQHATNPVDWYPWGEEAFEKARREDKPIFLSIGYSTCHWCHVMERESFENEQVAELLNRWFVPIKVDREERPDVDRIYMTAMQAMGVGGGWPLNAFLTPDLEPFFGGTYFPPDSMLGRPGMLQVLPRVHEAWTTQREQLVETGGRVLAALTTLSEPEGEETEFEPLLVNAERQLARMNDPEHGGFGSAPKFPSTVNLDFLLRWYARDPERHVEARAMVERQLDAMMRGGIHDHLGGGFHRYATDRAWLVPHFEKMLYDQAQLASAYLEGFQVTRNARYAETARGVFRYVERDLSSPEGGFDSAEDADSEGEEGKFYVWTPAELEALLGRDDAALFAFRYGVSPGGNFEHGTTILEESQTLEATAAHAGVSIDDARKRLERSSARLLEARSKRVRPHRDDKVLTAWNGLMISAFARGARVLGEPALADRAARAAEFVWTHLRDPGTGELKRRWRAGEAEGAGQLDDYANFCLGCLDLYAATYDPRWLERAEQVTAEQIRRLWDERDGGFFESPAGDPSIKVRMKDGFDGAEIAGNSIAAWNLQVLAALLDRPAWHELARRQLDYFARRLASQPVAMPRMLVAMELARSRPRHVVVAGRAGAADTRALVAEFDKRFLPHDQLLLADTGSPQALARLVPFTASLTAQHGKATAYVCVDYACKLPTSDPAAFGHQLDEREPQPVAATR